MSKNDNLKDLRKKIREIDDQILYLMNDRLKLAREIGQQKLDKNLPIKDFKVEKEVIDKSCETARDIGLYEQMAKEAAQLLIKYAVSAQEEFHDYSRHKAGSKKKNIIIIGGFGKMGSWLVQFFDSLGHQVSIYDNSNSVPPEIITFPVIPNLESTKDFDIIVLSTPITTTSSIISQLAKIKPKALVFDICSLKSPVLDSIHKAEEAGLRITSIHPMFGPNVELLSGHNFIFCETKDKSLCDEAEELFRDTSASLYRIPIGLHDSFISYVLGLSHLINLVFQYNRSYNV